MDPKAMTSAQAQIASGGATRMLRLDADGAGGVVLGITEYRPAKRILRRPALLVHGATLGIQLFDLPRPGYSLFSAIGEPGRVVYGVDIRGYGNSLGGKVMESPPAVHGPFARLENAVEDIAAAVEFICEREATTTVDLIGFSWGTVATARYATQFSHRVARLALYAPLYAERNELWVDRIGDPADRTRINPSIGAYRLVSLADIQQRWDADLGPLDRESVRDRGMVELVFETLAVLDPQSYSHSPPAFRSPAGALVDLFRIFNGEPLYDPGLITKPTLLVRGAEDTTSTESDTKRLLSAIASAEKEYLAISPGSHFLCIEKSRNELYKSLRDFLDAGE
jgi:pimeloyl-ACP methyl ester carboxylesterase